MAVIRKRKALNKSDIKDICEKITEEDNEEEDSEKKEVEDVQETFKTKCWEYIKLIFKLLLLITIAPALVNFAALLREEKELKPEGFMIDIKNGQKIFKTCLGKGSPTVILDAPLGETSDIWSSIMPEIAKLTKVCTYDRAGLGYSDRPYKNFNKTKNSAKPYTIEGMVEDFHKVFETESKPFILVGGDLGASIINFYTQLFTDSVASVVLVNPLFEGLFVGEDTNPWNKYWFGSVLATLQLKHISSASGLTRIGLQTGLIKEPYNFPDVPDLVKLRQKYLLCNPGHISSVVEESFHLNESLAQIRTLRKIRPFPSNVAVNVIFSEKYNENISTERNRLWLKSQELATQIYPKDLLKITKIKGFSPSLFFNSHQKIVSIVRLNIGKWKNSRKRNAKY